MTSLVLISRTRSLLNQGHIQLLFQLGRTTVQAGSEPLQCSGSEAKSQESLVTQFGRPYQLNECGTIRLVDLIALTASTAVEVRLAVKKARSADLATTHSNGFPGKGGMGLPGPWPYVDGTRKFLLEFGRDGEID